MIQVMKEKTMPLDGNLKAFEVRRMDDPAADRRRRLVEALRSPMPAGFRWDFGRLGSKHAPCGCGIGLAYYLDIFPDTMGLDEALGVSQQEASLLIGTPPHIDIYGVNRPELVTPAMVADVLESIGSCR